jgi:hypothetical protein
MKARMLGLAAGAAFLLGCASNDVAQKDTLNDQSDRMAATEDRRPPNPNRPNDTRDLKSVPTVVLHDPTYNEEKPDQREDKGLETNAGKDQLVRPQDPTVTDEAPKATGSPAATERALTISKADTELATRVKDAISKARNKDANVDPVKTADPATVEAKAVQNLEITAKDGTVMLSGSVESETERTAIEQAATSVAGVKSVENYLTVTKSNQQ